MQKYAYLVFTLLFSLIGIAIFVIRKDLRSRMINTSIIGGLAGGIAEFGYFKDYGNPPLLLGRSGFSVEDFLFGFAITGIALTLYDVVFETKNVQGYENRKAFFLKLFLLGSVSLIIFSNLLKINSIFVSSITFIIFSIIMVIIRKDLGKVCIVSGFLLVFVSFLVYIINFIILFPNFGNQYGLLGNTKAGIMILGHIPLLELVWYFSWGCLAGVGYNFVSGDKKLKKIN